MPWFCGPFFSCFNTSLSLLHSFLSGRVWSFLTKTLLNFSADFNFLISVRSLLLPPLDSQSTRSGWGSHVFLPFAGLWCHALYWGAHASSELYLCTSSLLVPLWLGQLLTSWFWEAINHNILLALVSISFLKKTLVLSKTFLITDCCMVCARFLGPLRNFRSTQNFRSTR